MPENSLSPDQTVHLLDLAPVTAGAVLSRTLVKNSAGTVTIFAFGQGQGLSSHSAPFDALVHVLDGKARVTIADRVHELGAGDAVLMPAGVAHALEATTDFRMVLVMLRGT
jgi:quercetin dioxygenase-like cupin family protein